MSLLKAASKQALSVFKWLVTTLLLGYVLYKAGLFSREGIQQFLSVLANADWRWLALSFLLPIVMTWFSSIKWWYLSRIIDLRSSANALFRYYLIGKFFNLILPSNIGGDVIRIRLQGREARGYSLSAAAVFMDRYTGMVVLLVLAALALMFTSSLKLPFMREAMLLSLLGLGAITWLLFHRKVMQRVRQMVEPRFHFTQSIFAKLERFQQKLVLYTERPRALGGGLVLGVGFYLLSICYIWLCLLAFESSTPFMVALLGVPLIMVLMNLPISVGGIGLAEFGFTVVFGAMGVAPETALAGVLLLRLHTFYMAGIGWVLYLLQRNEPEVEAVLAEVQQDAGTDVNAGADAPAAVPVATQVKGVANHPSHSSD